ncbi:hypothetical protein TpMuguga_01g02150 [Theileria parva strain Muguga]|uniref:uncharacterized protein n=1 Tax=Theileria parva strain Muguga TaxID=333668 RepID=UPI001C62276C|nr:uncharacterized protein TpMuguga_01g02150 [Theileria parva strain Muguga]KAF5153425.1 hypothetical protein TpMuguga_01g02150 [Theileria parva strain Muguga]
MKKLGIISLIILSLEVVENVDLCPKGWSMSYVTPEICEAPLSYHGPCSKHIITANNIKDKSILQHQCHVKWGGTELCVRDMTKCPKNWVKIDNSCVPTGAYRGNCVEIPEEMELTQKILWSIKCNTQFTCKNCMKNYDVRCPEEWRLVGRDCIAPEGYTGPCHTIANLSFFNHTMKEQFEAVCNAEFPCKT